MSTLYTFKLNDGRRYSAIGQNRFGAQNKIELAWDVDLRGATFTEFHKLNAVRTGIVK